jgi:UDP-glucose 4-epimerase
MKVLITGGSGFIGSYLAEKLLSQGHHVVVISNTLNPTNLSGINGIQSNFKLINCNYFKNPDWDFLLKDIEVVYHLLWTSLPRNSFDLAIQDIETNVVHSLALLNACVKNKVKKFVFTSSGGTVYGITGNEKIKEDRIKNPISNYGLTKLMFEKYLELYQYQYGLKYAILRISNVFGERQNPEKKQGVISTWIDKIIKNKEIEIWGDGSIIRDYVYVKDVVESIELAGTLSQENEIYNVGSGFGISLNELLQILNNTLSLHPKVIYLNKHSNDVPFNILDISYIKEKLGWYPKTSLEDGIIKTYNYLNYLK